MREIARMAGLAFALVVGTRQLAIMYYDGVFDSERRSYPYILRRPHYYRNDFQVINPPDDFQEIPLNDFQK